MVLPHATIAARRWTRNGLREAPRSLPGSMGPAPSANSWLCGAHTRDATRHAARVPPSFPLAANQLRATHGRTRTGACVTVGCQLCVCQREREKERERECVYLQNTPRHVCIPRPPCPGGAQYSRQPRAAAHLELFPHAVTCNLCRESSRLDLSHGRHGCSAHSTLILGYRRACMYTGRECSKGSRNAVRIPSSLRPSLWNQVAREREHRSTASVW